MQEGTTNQKIKITIQYCKSCNSHSWCTHHDESKYKQAYLDLSQALRKQFPNLQISGNQVPTYLVPIKAKENKFFDSRQRKYVLFPAIGAFQVFVNDCLIFSKKNTNIWPNNADIINSISMKITGQPSKLKESSVISTEKNRISQKQQKQTVKLATNILRNLDNDSFYHDKSKNQLTLTDHFKRYKMKKKTKQSLESLYAESQSTKNGRISKITQEDIQKLHLLWGKKANLPNFIKNKALIQQNQGRKEMLVNLSSIQQQGQLKQINVSKPKNRKSKLSTLDLQFQKLEKKFSRFQTRVSQVNSKRFEFDGIQQGINKKKLDNRKFNIVQKINQVKNAYNPQKFVKQIKDKKKRKIQEYIYFTSEQKNEKLQKIYGPQYMKPNLAASKLKFYRNSKISKITDSQNKKSPSKYNSRSNSRSKSRSNSNQDQNSNKNSSSNQQSGSDLSQCDSNSDILQQPKIKRDNNSSHTSKFSKQYSATQSNFKPALKRPIYTRQKLSSSPKFLDSSNLENTFEREKRLFQSRSVLHKTTKTAKNNSKNKQNCYQNQQKPVPNCELVNNKFRDTQTTFKANQSQFSMSRQGFFKQKIRNSIHIKKSQLKKVKKTAQKNAAQKQKQVFKIYSEPQKKPIKLVERKINKQPKQLQSSSQIQQQYQKSLSFKKSKRAKKIQSTKKIYKNLKQSRQKSQTDSDQNYQGSPKKRSKKQENEPISVRKERIQSRSKAKTEKSQISSKKFKKNKVKHSKQNTKRSRSEKQPSLRQASSSKNTKRSKNKRLKQNRSNCSKNSDIRQQQRQQNSNDQSCLQQKQQQQQQQRQIIRQRLRKRQISTGAKVDEKREQIRKQKKYNSGVSVSVKKIKSIASGKQLPNDTKENKQNNQNYENDQQQPKSQTNIQQKVKKQKNDDNLNQKAQINRQFNIYKEQKSMQIVQKSQQNQSQQNLNQVENKNQGKSLKNLKNSSTSPNKNKNNRAPKQTKSKQQQKQSEQPKQEQKQNLQYCTPQCQVNNVQAESKPRRIYEIDEEKPEMVDASVQKNFTHKQEKQSQTPLSPAAYNQQNVQNSPILSRSSKSPNKNIFSGSGKKSQFLEDVSVDQMEEESEFRQAKNVQQMATQQKQFRPLIKYQKAAITKQLYGQFYQQYMNGKKWQKAKTNEEMEKCQMIEIQKLYQGKNKKSVLFDRNSIGFEKVVDFTGKYGNFCKILRILCQKNQFLIVRLFQNPQIAQPDKFGVWLCDSYKWKYYQIQKQKPIQVNKQILPIKIHHQQFQKWPIILFQALAIKYNGYQNLSQVSVPQLFHALTGSNFLIFKIKQDPQKNAKFLKFLFSNQKKNFIITAQKRLAQNLAECSTNQIFYVLSQKQVPNTKQTVLRMKRPNSDPFWIKLDNFVFQFNQVDILQLRINHNFSILELQQCREGYFKIIEMGFADGGFGAVAVTSPVQTDIKAYLYREEKDHVLRLVGQVGGKKRKIFFDCVFEEGKYFFFVDVKHCCCDVSFLGENKPTMVVKQQIQEIGLRSKFTEYVPIQQKPCRQQQQMPKFLNLTKKSEKDSQFGIESALYSQNLSKKNKGSKIDKDQLRTEFVKFLVNNN